MEKLNRELWHWKKIYNTVRPYQVLGYLTSQQFLPQISSQREKENVTHETSTST